MRKFALLPLIFGLAGFGSAQAQVRDLFAEFEQEATSSAVETPAPASSAAKADAKPAAPVVSSSSEAAKPAAPAAVSSSSVAKVESSSSVAPVSSSVMSSAAAPVSSSAVLSSSSVVVADTASKDSAVVAQSSASDSLAAVTDSTKSADSTAKQDSLDPGQAYMASVNAQVDSAKARDSLAALSSSSSLNLSSSSMSRRDLLGPVKVSKVHSIDEMKGKYKSPRKALFMSLVVPGSGQLYVGGSKFTYLRGAIYLAIEAGLWTGWYYNTIYKYDKQVDKYKDFANKHYSIGRYENGMYDLFTSLNDIEEEKRFAERYMNSRESFCEALYGNAGTRDCYVSKNLPYEKETPHKKFFGNDPQSLGKERKEFKNGFYESSEVYQMIGSSSFMLGWDDADSVALASTLNLDDPNSAVVSLGKSKNRDKYRSMRSDANDLANMQAWFIGGLILNHLVSAVDAVFTANSHNKSLYEEDLSWYDRLHFDSGVYFFDGLGVDVRASWGF